ncbi:acetyl-CoA carboxylase carboxyltransferase subunit alpha [Croceicoccus marinus]|jgi:acetyl-CoA carboxylase carboxyl transferase subunit alpha|uniref:Acetyl-coenzyme A carboxylase carboxyl transferase subunit alpha n=1 Tax=Croceicoccus marinus TaxID=450378 RepID=A0A7G6VWP5_9SPHN|nr:acetyl-CoA carboxylase carboxyltransferase subunit alpha [Croceicoccus marinus]QNE06160.1 acetyl-CoA carboxylase carboxyltransferase subunit alpha [Croceicoccus marinus]
MISYLEFEKPLAELEAQIKALRDTSDKDDVVDISSEVSKLEAKAANQRAQIYRQLSPWQKTQVARHPQRPHFKDYVAQLTDDFMALGGDRSFADDQAILGGFATLKTGQKVMLIGHEKGHDVQSRLKHNFGMGKPEGYRKAVRLMEMAGRFGLPVVTLVDTSGAFPGIEAEERGQAEAIARATQACLDLPVPMVATIVGEGGSGGAVALASAECVMMMEHAVYSVISPEGCASILWRTAEKAPDAAEAMKVTAQNLKELGVIDRIVPEPLGGAHRDHAAAADALGKAIDEELGRLAGQDAAQLRSRRAERFLQIGSRF